MKKKDGGLSELPPPGGHLHEERERLDVLLQLVLKVLVAGASTHVRRTGRVAEPEREQ